MDTSKILELFDEQMRPPGVFEGDGYTMVFRPPADGDVEGLIEKLRSYDGYRAAILSGQLRPGERLLVNGANGAVGLAAVQMGLVTGVRVLANVRSEAAAERLRAMGAETVALWDARDVDVVLELRDEHFEVREP